MAAEERPAVELGAWLQARDWGRLQRHFARVPPATAADFEARALATMALHPGAGGARAALADLRQACRLEPGNVLAAANLMQALIDAGEADEALRLTRDAMRQAPQIVPLAEKHAWALVAAARWDEARLAVAHAIEAARKAELPASEAMAALAAELDTAWWQPLRLGDIELRLPAEIDQAFVAACFQSGDFLSRYRRFQAADEVAVRNFVDLARRRPLQTSRIDWIVWRGVEALGLASVSDLDFGHRRGELLVGLLAPRAAASAGLKASLAVMDFFFARLKMRKLVSYVYGDNEAAQANTLHLGLRQEGLLRRHLLTPAGELDLYVNGLLADEYHADARLQRLLARWRPR
ncbi:MAG: tetratricopeptide repeat protein [Rubrivivax sp.]